MMYGKKTTDGFAYRFVKPYVGDLVLYFLLTCMAAVFSIASVLSLNNFLQILFSTQPDQTAAASELEKMLNEIYMYFIAFGRQKALWIFAGMIFGIYFLKDLFTYMASYLIGSCRNRMIRNIRNELFDRYLRLSASTVGKYKKGDLLSRLSNDVIEYDQNVLQSMQSLISAFINVGLHFAVLIYINYKLTLVVLLVFPPVALVVSYISRKLRRNSGHMQQKSAHLVSIFEETISALRVIKSHTAIDFVNERFRKFNRSYSRLRNRIYRRVDLASPQSEFFGNFLVIGILLLGSASVIGPQPTMSAEMFVVYLIIFSLIIKPAKDMSTSFYNIKKGEAAKERMCELLNCKDEVPEPLTPVGFDGLRQGIRICGVSFAYDNENVLSNLNIFFKKGTNTAIVGASGSGKSTLTGLLLKFYQPQKGEIFFDDKNIRELTARQIREHVSIVTQETVLFNDTVANNISFGRKDYTLEQIRQAAVVANADGFIEKLPHSYQTVIGDRGNNLSGGQRQRLAIARAVLRNTDILIFDEATSALDTVSERSVQEAINRLSKDRTIITIAHRLSTIRQCDNIIVLDKGRVVESGTHEQLIGRQGVYHTLCKMQELK